MRLHATLLIALATIPFITTTSCAPSEKDPNLLAPFSSGSKAGAACTTDSDCGGESCERGTCAATSTSTDGTAPPAAECKDHSDCESGGCGDDGKCASAPSCTRAHGGRTCGPDGNDDCCAVAKQGDFTIDKYLVTAGRMRAFVERFDGNIQGFVDTLPEGRWNPAWNDPDAIPKDIDSANAILGPFAKKKACNQGPFTGHTYWTPKTEEDFSDFDADTLDEKALNCVPWAMLQALCAFDGGHLATLAELKAAFTNGGTTRYPWGDANLASVSRPDPEERLNIEGGFKTTPLPATFRANSNGEPAEVSFMISPPGRYPKGNNKVGIADSAGNLLEWVGDQQRRFVWKADFEHHAANAASFNFGYFWWEARASIPVGLGFGPWIWGESQLYGNAGNRNEKNGYYSIGGRCAH